MEEKEITAKEENKRITSKFEIFIVIVAFISLAAQSIIFYTEYRGKDWLSSFGDYFGFSAAFLSALVIVLLIKELREQRQSRIKLASKLQRPGSVSPKTIEYPDSIFG